MNLTTLSASFALTLSLACGGSPKEAQNSNQQPAASNQQPAAAHHDQVDQKDIVATAVSAGNFTTLVAALEAADLVLTLQGDGPFTVFAPTDEAFAKLPAGTVEALLQDKEKLAAILAYHVVSGKVLAKDVVALNSALTLQGQSVSIDASNGVRINDSMVVAADVVASNGVVHVIDTVLIPN